MTQLTRIPATSIRRLALGVCACVLLAPAVARAGSGQAYWLSLAKTGVAAAQRAWHAPQGWYYERLGGPGAYPLATIWGAAPLFETLDAIAIAQPTAANKAAVASFAAVAETYWNPGAGGYGPYPGDRSAASTTWFDDDGWWGLGFLDAYRATHDRRYLTDAGRALRFIAARGWDSAGGGGIWWNTSHPYKSGPALASDTLLAALLWRYTHSSFALAQAQKFIAWANAAGFSAPDGLYRESSRQSTPVDYVQAPLAYAQLLLCRGGQDAGGCAREQAIMTQSLQRFGDQLDFSPQYDAPYLQWALAIYAAGGNSRLYDIALSAGHSAASHAASGAGLYLRGWHGETLPGALDQPGLLRTDAATLSLFAWLAVAAPPAA